MTITNHCRRILIDASFLDFTIYLLAKKISLKTLAHGINYQGTKVAEVVSVKELGRDDCI